ncbi:MAG: WG repeat-containing protein [Ignavibacteriae bacterium]|nr:WG repeat-containing protein [Ignavibacteriota bacterium]
MQYLEVGDFSEGLAVIRKLDGNYGVIDTTGTLLYTTPYTFYLWSGRYTGGDCFHHGVVVCHTGSLDASAQVLYGIMDKDGKTVLAPSFHYIGGFSEGVAVAKPSKSGKYGFIDVAGNWIVQPRFSSAWDFSENLACVADDSARIGYIDRNGSLIIPTIYKEGGSFSEGLAPVRSFDGTWKYIDAAGRTVLNMDSLGTRGTCRQFSEGLAAVCRFGSTWPCFIDRNGRTVISDIAPYVGDFHDGIAAKHWAGVESVGYINRSGTALFGFDSGRDFVNGYASVGMMCVCDGSWINRGIIDRTGNIVVPMKYYSVGSYSGGFLAIHTGHRAGHINLQGVILGTHP